MASVGGGALAGRERDLARLREAVAAAVSGAGGLVLVTGEAGIGKTSLVEAASAEARGEGVAVLWGTCREGRGVPGFWPWVEALRAGEEQGLGTVSSAGADVAGLVELGSGSGASGATAGPDGGSERFAVFDAVGRALQRAGRDRPVMVVLDDLHWADAGSLRLLAFLVPDLTRGRVLVVGMYRDDEVDAFDHPLRALLGGLASRACWLPPRGLDLAEVGGLLARLDGRTPDVELVATVHRRSGGNPFFVHQVHRLHATTARVPIGVRDVVTRRLGSLRERSVSLLDVAAVIGRDVTLPLLCAVTERGAGDVSEALDAAMAARIVEPVDANRFQFTHDLFREVLYEDLEAVNRARLHTRVADALQGSSPSGRPGLASDIARHRVLGAAVGGIGLALPALRLAADEATRRAAYEEAAAHLGDGVRLARLARDGPVGRELLVDLGDAHRRAGDLGRAREVYLEAAAEAEPAADRDTLARAALGIHEVGAPTWSSHDDAIALLGSAIEMSEGDDPVTARLLAALARELVHGPGEVERARLLADHAVELARRLGDPATLTRCLFALHDAQWIAGSAPARLVTLDGMYEAALAAHDRQLAWEAQFARFVAQLELADPAAYATFDRVVAGAEALGQPHYRWLVLTRRAVLASLAGRFEQAEQLAAEAGALAERLGEPDGRNVTGDLRLSLSALRGDLRQTLAAFSVGYDAMSSIPRSFLASLEAMALIETGDAAGAMEALRPWIEPGLAGARGWQQLGAAAIPAVVAAMSRDGPLCGRLYELLSPHAGQMVVTGGAASVVGPVCLYLGLLAAALERYDDAVAHFTAAVSTAERISAHPWAAIARYELARTLVDRGHSDDRPEAALLVDAAATAATRIGMHALAERATRLSAVMSPPANEFRRDGALWLLSFEGTSVHLADIKGLRDIARLLASPGVEVPVSHLMGGDEATHAMTGADPVLDDQARSAYRRRLAELDDDIADADACHDPERAARARDERDTLIHAITSAYGKGGRPRRLGDPTERARKAVTARIRNAVVRIDRHHPELGRHLHDSITTGIRCCYRPDEPVHWRL